MMRLQSALALAAVVHKLDPRNLREITIFNATLHQLSNRVFLLTCGETSFSQSFSGVIATSGIPGVPLSTSLLILFVELSHCLRNVKINPVVPLITAVYPTDQFHRLHPKS
jgi:hypothetical protein